MAVGLPDESPLLLTYTLASSPLVGPLAGPKVTADVFDTELFEEPSVLGAETRISDRSMVLTVKPFYLRNWLVHRQTETYYG